MPINFLGDLAEEKLGIPEREIREIADAAFHEDPYSLKEVAALLDRSPVEIAAAFCLRRNGSIFPEPPGGFKLFQRYRHVIDEGRRVERALLAMRKSDLQGLGDLMNDSHRSCRDLYEISCPELDTLVDIARGAGAIGSRLTGAGFGGCAISMLRTNDMERFTERVIEKYYRAHLRLDRKDYSSILFACQPANGAEVLF